MQLQQLVNQLLPMAAQDPKKELKLEFSDPDENEVKHRQSVEIVTVEDDAIVLSHKE